ncbi:hypothetical protein JOL62DRAFT_234805 [Phyllosticta paracitricarpa]|uniref:Uncharacterized protein n=1 Tax=Phyllosticta paracitricarpa TaxID=2016321 RepID=A0ABR1NK85_9PEZI
MATNFAPYQDAAPETARAFSPPLRVRSPALSSPRTSSQQTRPKPGPRAASAAANGVTSPGVTTPPTTTTTTTTTTTATTTTAGGLHYNNTTTGYFDNPDQQSQPNQQQRGSRFGREEVDLFETRLGWRMDVEACAAYVLLPPAGAVLLLVLEHRSDYVRFHAWQSALLFSFAFVLHVIFSWTAFVSYLLLLGDLAVMAWLTVRAYRDAETLDRCEVPFFGPLASSILDDE